MAIRPTRRKGETSSTVSIGLRVDPKTKFAMDMMSRKHLRSLTATIEWAIAQAIAREESGRPGLSFADLVSLAWSVDEQERLLNMHKHCPELLSFDEEVAVRELLMKGVANEE